MTVSSICISILSMLSSSTVKVSNSKVMGPRLGAPQHQYVVFSQIHHPSSQPVGPNTGPTQGYTYGFGDPARPQTPVLASQYPVTASRHGIRWAHDDDVKWFISDSERGGVKQQQAGSSQPLWGVYTSEQ